MQGLENGKQRAQITYQKSARFGTGWNIKSETMPFLIPNKRQENEMLGKKTSCKLLMKKQQSIWRRSIYQKSKPLEWSNRNNVEIEGMWIGSQNNNDEKKLGINWPSEPIRALGVFFTYDQSLLYEKKKIPKQTW